MGLLKSWSTRYAKPGKGVNEPPPKSGVKRFTFILINHYAKLMLANLIFVAFCIPVVTIPASISGISNVMMQLVRNGSTFLWEDFWCEFKTDFFKRLIVWLPMVTTPVAVGLLVISTGAQHNIGVIIGAVFLVFSLIVQGYLFPLMATVNLSIRQSVKNAFILTILEWKSTLVMFLGIVLICVTMMFFPYSIILLLFFTFAFSQLMISVAANDAFNKHIIK